MYFAKAELLNFRNYSSLSVEFDRGLNLFLGKNAQGKTNLLESLFIMGLGKSFRTSKDRDMIAFGSEFSKVSCLISDGKYGRDTEIDIVYRPEGKIIRVDGTKLQRTVDLLENVYIVIFSPEDLRIIKDGPESRRRFVDRELCQIKPVYYSDLGNYKKVLKQRNMLLRERNTDKDLFCVFDNALCDYGIRICHEREEFTKRLSVISRDIHYKISGGKEELFISYETGISKGPSEDEKKSYLNRLESCFEKDLLSGYTSFGPHKDDLKLEINGTDIRQFGSQGQQRTAALSMKLAEIELIKQETGQNAVLLLDDVLSELDRARQLYLIRAMKDIQVFITATDIDSELLNMLPKGRKFTIESGTAQILTQ